MYASGKTVSGLEPALLTDGVALEKRAASSAASCAAPSASNSSIRSQTFAKSREFQSPS